MIVNATVAIKIGEKEWRTMPFSFQIPDDIIEEYARNSLDLMTFEEAVEDYEPEPDERDEDC